MSGIPDRSTITALLLEIHTLSSEDARSRLFDAVYEELRRMARGLMKDERSDHTLRPTALVHEAFVRMVEEEGLSWENRAHFLGISRRTADGDWITARSWLSRELSAGRA